MRSWTVPRPSPEQRGEKRAKAPERADGAARTSAAGLEAAALDYLARYSSSRLQLQRVLERRIRRWAPREAVDPAVARAAIPPLLNKLVRLGHLDDARFAAGHAMSLHRRGRSLGRIRSGLAARGVDRETAAVAIAALKATHADADFLAAAAHARRRRLGPYRAPRQREDNRARDLAALARAGFAFETARRVLAMASPAELEAECERLAMEPHP